MKTIITIGRQFGSGGREIGELLAKKLEIECYDKNLLKEAAQNSDFPQETFEYYDEQPNNSLIYTLFMNSVGNVTLPLNQQLFLAQFETIRKIAQKGSCIIIGRCGDYALKDEENVVNIFISANNDDRVKRISKKYNLTEQEAQKEINKKDKQRSSYYNYFTDMKWGSAEQHDLVINSSALGIEKTAEVLENFIRMIDSK